MVLIDTLRIASGTETKFVDLCSGDLTALAPGERVDILVVSAYPNSYLPLPGSLIGALNDKGVSLEGLFREKEVDLRAHHACWLSKKIEGAGPGIQFSYILCFEPEGKGNPPEVMGDIFRALYPFASEGGGITVAMPLVASGYQGWSSKRIVPPLLDAAYNWMKNGIGIKRLKICLHAEEDMRDIPPQFRRIKEKYMAAERAPADAPGAGKDIAYDLFLSYSHGNTGEAKEVLGTIRKIRPGFRIFFDRLSLNAGSSWQREIYEALEGCRAVMALLSPDYLASKVCMEEYHIAHARQRDSGTDFLFPLLLCETDLPYYMRSLQYIVLAKSEKTRSSSIANVIEKITDGKSGDAPAAARVSRPPKKAGAKKHRDTGENILGVIEALGKIYGRKIGLASIAKNAGISPDDAETILEDMILSGRLKANIDIRKSPAASEHILVLPAK